MRRTLPTRRQSSCSQTGDAYITNDRWIRDGVISERDPLPWLRAVQTQGFELTIIGSTVDAVRVCVEAWHAGFKPVLIIMEDQMAPGDEAEVRLLVHDLMRSHGAHGMFTYGPTPLYSDSSKCLVQLDDKGRAVDVCVCTNFGGLNTLAETWQLFKGPAIIVDPIGLSNEELEQQGAESSRGSFSVPQSSAQKGEPPSATTPDEKRRLFLSRVKAERSAVINPAFWEDRYDPERLSFWTVGYSEIFPNCFVGCAQMFVLIAVHARYIDPVFFLWRALADLVVEVPCGNALVLMYSQAIGLHLRNDAPTLLGIVGGMGYWLMNVIPMSLGIGGGLELKENTKYYPSDFFCSSFALFPLTAILALFAKKAKHLKITKAMLLWYAVVVAGTIGAWIGTIVTMLVYVILNGVQPVAASIFLTLAFTGLELAQVKLMLLGYDKFVWKPRKENPCNVLGDQKSSLTSCIVMIHCFTETGRVISMIVAMVRATSTDELMNILVSVCLSLVINTAGRTGWSGCLLARVARGFPRRVLCPTAVNGLHNEMKFAMGWPRFFILFGLFLGRGAIYGKWNANWTDEDPQVWCWNRLVLITVAMAFGAEVLEDWLVHLVIERCPAPYWGTFEPEMLARFDGPLKDDIYHPSHFLVPQSAFLAPKADCRLAPSLTSTALNQRISKASKRSDIFKGNGVTRISKCIRDLAPQLSVSPNFKHARYVSASQLQGPMGGMVVLTITAMCIGLGNGNFFGQCTPIATSEWPRLAYNLLVFTAACEPDVVPVL